MIFIFLILKITNKKQNSESHLFCRVLQNQNQVSNLITKLKIVEMSVIKHGFNDAIFIGLGDIFGNCSGKGKCHGLIGHNIRKCLKDIEALFATS